MNTQLTFGVELEITIPVNVNIAQLFAQLNIPFVAERYNHTTRNHWKSVGDISIRTTPGYKGVEIVSPILRGENDLNDVKRIANALEDAGAKVNKSCGMHVHVGAAHLTQRNFLKVLWNYAKYENVIDSFMPPSRRGNANQYCRSVLRLNETSNDIYLRLRNCTNDAAIVSGQETRYRKLNVASKTRQNTIEFRHHSGTVCSTKISNWIIFCLAFVENAESSTARIRTQTMTTGNEVKNLFQYVKLPELKTYYMARRKELRTRSARDTRRATARIRGGHTTRMVIPAFEAAVVSAHS